jgi:alkanesulfonate monooxygenase SsuD/methylene tetrahydromethanopterin reductase-like flavin-dependent oxidoreductase (luciferase family)
LQNHFPGRVFLGTGTGEALNEIPGGGGWGTYRERADRWVEAVQLIRQLWTGQPVTFQGQYYSENGGRLYDPPSQTIPLYMAASGPESGALAGQYGDGLITDPKMAQDPTMRAAWSNGAATGGQNVAQLQLLTEQYVVVGSEADAQVGAELWRFQPKAWHPYVLDPDPVDIHRRADAEVPLQQVYQDWPVSTDPNVHAQALQKLIAAGVTQIFVHSPLDDQLNAIQFYGQQVLPLLRGGMATS